MIRSAIVSTSTQLNVSAQDEFGGIEYPKRLSD